MWKIYEDGEFYDIETNKSVYPKGESYNIEKKKCEKECEEGEIYMKEEKNM